MSRGSLRRFLLLAGISPGTIVAQTKQLTLEELVGAGEQYLRENLDPKVIESVEKNIDPERAQELLEGLQQKFQGEYVLDLARTRKAAQALLPLLQAWPQTRSYAGWLAPRMDYFEVADQLSVDIPAPKPSPGQPPRPRPNPTPEQERRAWTVQVAKGPTSRGAAIWVSRLKPIFASERVAPELVWLAEVESSFNPEAQSPAGAVGLFQLMPATAQSLGLKLRPQDERNNGDKNARAAASYLRYLFLKFRDWRLALAAYNAGEGRIREALNSAHGKTFDDIARRLPAETQMYVPKFEAVLKRKEGKTMAQLPPARA